MWQYRVEERSAGLIRTVTHETWLNLLGQEGWELCAAVMDGDTIHYHFKRKIVS